jgi:hypothetical protein
MAPEHEIAKLREAYGDRFIEPAKVQVGDHALARRLGREDISGEVVRLTKTTATIKQRWRIGPGPWSEHEFKVPRSEILYVVRP